ncbi:MAG: hypothetical protein LGB73_05355 [Sulfurovum sp.]|nr:hypothetical protein [Sulfurovum sp.]
MKNTIKITPDLVLRTLKDNTDGFLFESFAQTFYSALTGNKFKPIGGLHDGGADGINEDVGLREEENKNTSFAQISIDKQPKAKIKKTIQRLISYGRDVKKLIYITSIIVNDIDKIEDDIFDELNVRLKIRDAKYISQNIQYSRQTELAFKDNLLATYDFFGSTSLMMQTSSELHDSNLPFLFAFIQRELENKTDRSSIVNSLTDSLTIWALEGTDPDKKQFMNNTQILKKILDTLPTTKTFIKGSLKHRLDVLSKTPTQHGRKVIQYHKKAGGFCLPYETRETIRSQNIEDETLFIEVQKIFLEKLKTYNSEFSNKKLEELVHILLRVLHITFENEGLEFVSFIENPEQDFNKHPIIYNIDKAFEEEGYTGSIIIEKELLIKLVSYIFYQSNNPIIKNYLNKLSETYILLLSLKADNRVVDYFEKMSEEFNLIIGSDMLVRALSENLLDGNMQSTTNMLKILKDTNSSLLCTEYIIDEVWNNLKTSDWEYKNHFSSIDQYMKVEIARESSKILIRSYFYHKLLSKTPKINSWQGFIERFCTYSDLHTSKGREELKKYLIYKFQLEFKDNDEINNLIDQEQVDKLTEVLKPVKKTEELALHSAKTVDLVYKIRKQNKETGSINQFGYKTWWLTSEKTTMRFTGDLVKNNYGFYIIRPEFLLHYIALVPSRKDVKETYKSVFPTILGIKLSGLISPEEYHKILKGIEACSQEEPARLQVKIEEAINKLKGDFIRAYDDTIDIE